MRFKVIDNKTGKEADPYEIALHEEWARSLVYCDMEGFAITEDGDLVLMDECGNVAYCDADRFEVVFENTRPHGEWKPLGEPDDLGIYSWYICSSCGFRTTWHMVDIFHFCPNCGADMRTQNDRSWDTSERGVSGSVKNSIAQEEGEEK